MASGTTPDPGDLDVLLQQCAVEPDLQVREMLTWALVRLPAALVVPRLLGELDRPEAQARSQALHTLSKIGDASVYPEVADRLGDVDAGVVRTAWRASVRLVPDTERPTLARRLGRDLGQGDQDVRLALSRALVALGEDVIEPVLAAAERRNGTEVRDHVADVRRLLRDPDAAADLALARARREVALGRTKRASG
jgi:HEAT repeat protein